MAERRGDPMNHDLVGDDEGGMPAEFVDVSENEPGDDEPPSEPSDGSGHREN